MLENAEGLLLVLGLLLGGVAFFALRRRAGKRPPDSASPTLFPPEWLEHLEKNVGLYPLLTSQEKAKLQRDALMIVDGKAWEGCGGLEMTDEIKVTIAAQACLLVLGVGHDHFRQVRSILVYPSAYRARTERLEGGVLEEGQQAVLGQAWEHGPVILAWDEVLRGGRDYRDGHNVVLHEFAHQLDFRGALTNAKAAGSEAERRRHAVFNEEYERLVRESASGEVTLLDAYGATSLAEFFAVATECFFEWGDRLHRKHPRLYEALCDFYRQDTAARLTRPLQESSRENS